MKTKILETTLCLFLMVGVMQLTAFAATDAKKTQDVSTNTETNQMLKQISDLDPDKPTLKEFVKPQNNARASTQSNSVTSDQGDFKVNIDTKNRKINLSKKDKSDISFSIPTDVNSKDIEVLGSKVVFTGKGGKYKNVVEAIDGGVRQLIYITSKDAPTTYEFPMNLASGDKAEIQTDGGVMVRDSKGDMKVLILKPWARDAKGKELKTWYTVEGNTLKQHIELKGAALPVTADPMWCGDFLGTLKWIDATMYSGAPNGAKTLEIPTTWCGRVAYRARLTAIGMQDWWGMWNEVLRKVPNNPAWDKSNINDTYYSMQDQFYCHSEMWPLKSVQGILAKDYSSGGVWHIEPWRKRVGIWVLILPWVGCNNL